MSQIPNKEEALFAASDTTLHPFAQQQINHYKQKNATFLKQLQIFKKNASENQKNYDATYHILHGLLHLDDTPLTKRLQSKRNHNALSRTRFFIEAFNRLFAIDKTRIIYLNQPALKHRNNPYTKAYSHSAFWDEIMCDLFTNKHISFAPIDQSISTKLFAKPTLKSAGMIPFYTNSAKPKTKSYQAMLVFGSTDANRFLPDSTYQLDLLTRIQNILSTL